MGLGDQGPEVQAAPIVKAILTKMMTGKEGAIGGTEVIAGRDLLMLRRKCMREK